MLFLEATAAGSWSDAIEATRRSIFDVGGDILDLRPFSGTLLSVHLELPTSRATDWVARLRSASVELVPSSQERLEVQLANDSSDPILNVRLAVRIPNGDPERRQIVPAIPG